MIYLQNTSDSDDSLKEVIEFPVDLFLSPNGTDAIVITFNQIVHLRVIEFYI